MNKNELILELIDLTEQNLTNAEVLFNQSLKDLNKKLDANSWSVLECISHLNIYGGFYFPEIENAIS
jgi:hypothetical protein